ncbi:MAG: acyltransferase [Ferruginibacter sp.]
MKTNRLDQLDGLRGLFCLMVILTHFPFKDSLPVSNFIVRQGYLFVDFFFVLSGFVIAFNYYDNINNTAAFKDYIQKRFLRLYPLLLYTVLVYLAFEIFFVLFFPQLLTHKETLGHLLYLTLDSLTFMNSTPVLGDNLGMNYPTWSISAEMISYMIFGLIVLLFRRSRLLSIVIILVLLMIFLGTKKMYLLEGDWGFARGLVCFFMGVIAFAFSRRYTAESIGNRLEYILPVLLVGLFYFRQQYFEKKGLFIEREIFTLLVVPLFFGSFVFVYAGSKGALVKILCSRFFQYVGKLSYSIYLNHAIVLILVVRGMFSVLKLQENEFNISLSLIVSIIATILYSDITYRLVEKKGKKLLASLLRLKK